MTKHQRKTPDEVYTWSEKRIWMIAHKLGCEKTQNRLAIGMNIRNLARGTALSCRWASAMYAKLFGKGAIRHEWKRVSELVAKNAQCCPEKVLFVWFPATPASHMVDLLISVVHTMKYSRSNDFLWCIFWGINLPSFLPVQSKPVVPAADCTRVLTQKIGNKRKCDCTRNAMCDWAWQRCLGDIFIFLRNEDLAAETNEIDEVSNADVPQRTGPLQGRSSSFVVPNASVFWLAFCKHKN